jgi:hypothetical protein
MSFLCRPDGFLQIKVKNPLRDTSVTQGDILILSNQNNNFDFVMQSECDGFGKSVFYDLLSTNNPTCIVKEIHFDTNIIEFGIVSEMNDFTSFLRGIDLKLFFPRTNELLSPSGSVLESCYSSFSNDIWKYNKNTDTDPTEPNYDVGFNKYNFNSLNLHACGFEKKTSDTDINNRYILLSNQHVLFSSVQPIDSMSGSLFQDEFACLDDGIYTDTDRASIINNNDFFGILKHPMASSDNINLDVSGILESLSQYHPSIIRNIIEKNSFSGDNIRNAFDKIFSAKKVKFFSSKTKSMIQRDIVLTMPLHNYFKEKFKITDGISGVCVGLLDRPIDLYSSGLKPIAVSSAASSYLNVSENSELACINNNYRLQFLLPTNKLGHFKVTNDRVVNTNVERDMFNNFGSSYFDETDIGSFVISKGKKQAIISGIINSVSNSNGVVDVLENEICINFGSNCMVKEFINKSIKIPNRSNPFSLTGKSSYGEISNSSDFQRSSDIVCNNYSIFSKDHLEAFLNDHEYWKISDLHNIWESSFEFPDVVLEVDDMESSTGSGSPVLFAQKSFLFDASSSSIDYGDTPSIIIESPASNSASEQFGINYFTNIFGGAVHDSINIDFRNTTKVVAVADSINGSVSFLNGTNFSKYDHLTMTVASVSHSNSGDADHIVVEDSFEGINSGLPSTLSQVVHANINISSLMTKRSDVDSDDLEGFQSLAIVNDSSENINYISSDFNKKQIYRSLPVGNSENHISSMVYDKDNSCILFGGKGGVYKFSNYLGDLYNSNISIDTRFPDSLECIKILNSVLEIVAICKGTISVYNKISNESYVTNLNGFPFKILGGFITSNNDIAILTSGGIYIKYKDSNQIIPILYEISIPSSSSSSSSSNSSSSSSSNLFNGAVSFYHGIGGPNNYALSDSNIYVSTNLSQWVKLQGQLPSNIISDIKLFNYKLYLCTDTGFYQINGSGNGFDFTKIIIDLNNPNLAVNSVGSSFYFNDDGAMLDQIMLIGDEKGRVYSFNQSSAATSNQTAPPPTIILIQQTKFETIHGILRAENDWIISSYNQFKFLNKDKIFTLSLGIDI